MEQKLSVLGVITGALLAASAGCAPPEPVGPECEDDRDCAAVSTCLTGEAFPGGLCTLRCEGVAGCTATSWCVGYQGGVCLPECDSEADCRQGWMCGKQSVKGGTGDPVSVCIKDDGSAAMPAP